MSATVSAFGHRGTTSSVKTEIARELVNASDGAGLHFDGAAGYIDIASPPDLGTKFSFEFVIKADSWGGNFYIIDFGTGGRFLFLADSTNNDNLAIYDTGYRDFGVAVLDDLKVHHLVVTVDGTAATLYDNGNQVGTTTLGATPDIDDCSDAKIASNYPGNNGFIDGTIYRARFYNRTLSADDVRTAFERADIDFADQYGSASNLITNGNFETNTSGWTSENTSTFQRNTTSPISGTGDLEWTGDGSGYPGAISNSFSLTAGKKYRIKFTYRVTSGTVYLKFGKTAAAASAAVAGISEVALTASSNTAYEATITPTETTTAYIVFRGNNNTTPTMFVDLVDFVQIGCVSDYDLAFANENQSRMVADRSTNNVDGEMSSSGVKQTQVIKQLNSTAMRIGGTSATAATPADGEVIADKIGVGVAPSTLADFKASSFNGAKIKLINSDYNNTNEFTAGIGNLDIFANTTTVLGAEYRYLRLGVGTTEAMRIDASGDITSTNATGSKPILTLENTTNDANSSQLLFKKNRTATNNDVLGTVRFRGNNNAGTPEVIEYATIYAQSTNVADSGEDGQLIFRTIKDGSLGARLTIDGTGLATFSNGIAFSQTNSSATGATATGTTLDHYEEGTWTPTYAPSAGSYTSLTMSVTSAKYTRVGDVCYLEAYIETDGTVNTTGGSGNLKISGLPFTSATGYGASFAVGYAANWGTNDAPLGGYIEAGLAAITLSARSSVGGQQVSINFNNLDTGTDKNRLLFSGSYKVA